MGKSNNDAEKEVYRFIKILIVVIVFVVGMYFITNKIASKTAKDNKQAGEVSSNAIIVGSLLNRPYSEYYVIAFKSKDYDAAIYDTYISAYEAKEKALRIYAIDLDNELNKDYYSEKGSPNAKSIDELKISSPTLIKVKDKKINKYIEGQENIKKELGL